MEAVGRVDDHETSGPKHANINVLARRWADSGTSDQMLSQGLTGDCIPTNSRIHPAIPA